MKESMIAKLIEVGEMYYIKGLSQKQIAQKMSYSTSKVSRMLKKCINTNIIEININYPLDRVSFLEDKIKNYFLLKDVLVLKDYYTSQSVLLNRYGKLASEYINGLIKDGTQIGVGSGRTLYSVIEHIKYSKKTSVSLVQLKGMAFQESNYKYDSPVLIRMLAKKLNANYHLLYSPLYVKNPIARDYLLKDELIKKTLIAARNVDIVLTGISSNILNNKSSSWMGYIEEEKIKKMYKDNISGCMLAHFIKEDGKVADMDLEDSIIGLKFEELRNIPNVILLAVDKIKISGVMSALKSGIINTLIINESLAKEISNIISLSAVNMTKNRI